MYSDVFRMSGLGDNMTVHKADRHGKRGRRRRASLKDGATFDPELQRYVMPKERNAAMPKQDKS